MENALALSAGDQVGTQRTAWTDLAGMAASLGCAVHCAAMPFVIGYLPSLGLGWVAGHSFHQWMAGICAVIALMAFIPGFKRHRRWLPMMLGVVGIAFLSSAAFALEPCCEYCASPDQAQQSDSLAASACASCDGCDSQPPTQIETQTSSSGWLTKFITPMGGMVLIVAHLFNHRFDCRCCAREKHCQADDVFPVGSTYSTDA